MLETEKVIRHIQRFTGRHVFRCEPDERGRLIDNWRHEWIELLNEKLKLPQPLKPGARWGGGQSLSHHTLKAIQEEVQSEFGEVESEKPVVPAFSLDGFDKQPNLKFDLFIPSENAAIEICMSAITHEWEKDILKALADKGTRILRVMARRLVSGGGYYSKKNARSPSGQMWKALASVYKLDVEAVDLVR